MKKLILQQGDFVECIQTDKQAKKHLTVGYIYEVLKVRKGNKPGFIFIDDIGEKKHSSFNTKIFIKSSSPYTKGQKEVMLYFIKEVQHLESNRQDLVNLGIWDLDSEVIQKDTYNKLIEQYLKMLLVDKHWNNN